MQEGMTRIEYIAYFLYGFGQVLNYAVVGTYISIFYSDYLLIGTTFIGGLFLIARVFDALNDPVMAALIDKTNTSKGKFRIWMKWISFGVVFSSMMLYIPWEFEDIILLTIVSVTYIAWGMIYTVSDVPFWSLSTAMSQNPQERAKAVTTGNAGVNLGFLLPGLLVPIISKFIGFNILDVQGTNNEAFLSGLPWAMMFISLMTLPMMLFGYKFTKERRKVDYEKISIKDMISTIKQTKPLYIIVIIFLLDLFWELQAALITYFFVWNMKDASLQSTVTLWSVLAFLLLFIYPWLTKYFQKKKILRYYLLGDTLLRIAIIVIGYENIVTTVILLILLNIIRTIFSPIIPNMIGETIEYAEYKTGKRTEAIIFSIQTFSGKLKTAIALGGSGFLLTLIGYNPGHSEQTASTLNWLFLLCILLPMLGNILRIFFTFKIKFTEVQYKLVVDYLEQRHLYVEALEEDNKEGIRYHNQKMNELNKLIN